MFTHSARSGQLLLYFAVASMIGTPIHITGWLLVILGYGIAGVVLLIAGGYITLSGPLCLTYRWLPLGRFWRWVTRR